MVGKEQKQKIKKKTLLLVVVTTSFLGASVFAVLSGLSTRQKEQELAQLVIEEQLSRVPQILLSDSSLPKDSESLAVRYRAAAKLNSKEAIPKLISLLQSPSEYARSSAAQSLGNLNAKEAISELILLLQDPSENVRSSAAQSLGNLNAKEAISELILLLQDPSESVHSSAAQSLGRLNAKEAISELISLLQDSRDYVRSSAAYLLSELNAREAIPELILLIQDPSESIRLSAVDLLSRLNAREAIPELISLLQNSKDYITQLSAADSLSRLNAREAIPELISLPRNSNYYITRLSAADSLSRLNSKEAISESISLPQDHRNVQPSAVYLSREVPELISLLQDPRVFVRYGAAQSLGNLNAKEAIPELISMLQDSSVDVQSSAAQSLTEIYLVRKQKPDVKITHVEQARLVYNLKLAFTGIAVISAISFLFLMLQQTRHFQGITWSGYWICYFPEEVVQDLADLSDRLAQEGKTTRQIRTRIYAEILTLIWAFYIQINIENLWLPKGDRRIDD
jgi:HEAT repeat protein